MLLFISLNYNIITIFSKNGLKYPIFLDLLLVHATFLLTMFLPSSKYCRFRLYASNVNSLNIC